MKERGSGRGKKDDFINTIIWSYWTSWDEGTVQYHHYFLCFVWISACSSELNFSLKFWTWQRRPTSFDGLDVSFWSCQLLLVLHLATECCKGSNECGNTRVVYMLFARFPVKPQNIIHFVAKGAIGSKIWHIPSSPGHVSFPSFWQKLSKNKSFVKSVCVCMRLTELEAFVLHDKSNTQKLSFMCFVYFQRVFVSLQAAELYGCIWHGFPYSASAETI